MPDNAQDTERFPSPAEAEKMPKCANCGHIDPEHGFNGPCEADWGKCPCKRFIEPGNSEPSESKSEHSAQATFSVAERRHDYLLQIEQRAKTALRVGQENGEGFYRGVEAAADYILNGADDDNEFGEQP